MKRRAPFAGAHMKFWRLVFSRLSIIGLFLLLQLILFFAFTLSLTEFFIPYQITSLIIGLVILLKIVNTYGPPEHKIPWIVVVLLMPLFGTFLYFVFHRNRPSLPQRRAFKKIEQQTAAYLEKSHEPQRHAEQLPALGEAAGQSHHLFQASGMGAYDQTKSTFFATGEAFWESLLADLKAAKHFIFMEYFIIEEGRMWDAILEILREKAEQQVDVRVMYDDLGSITKIPAKYDRKLRSYGIHCVKFNPFRPILSAVHNNRDHRKITVIDGTVGYTGGINLADEYINHTHPYGVWNDAAVRLEGEGVKGLTMMFLQNFDFSTGSFDNFEEYMPAGDFAFHDCGWVQSFGDGPKPWLEEQVGENAYLNLINQAKHKLYVTTPYLIADHTLLNALTLAARRGVDVRIITPHVPDKRAVFWLTRSNYAPLIAGGVKIYEYTPGFMHAKVMLSDDTAIVGTINLDYRSLVHHFECGVWLHRTPCILDIAENFQKLFAESALQTEESAKLSFPARLAASLIKVFAVLF